MIVMDYADKGNLRNGLSDIVKSVWGTKLRLLRELIMGLDTIHELNLVHGNLHDGNILVYKFLQVSHSVLVMWAVDL